MEDGLIGYISHQVVGSTYVFGEGNDKDVLVLVENAIQARNHALERGWRLETTREYEGTKFYSLRRGDDNVLIVEDPEYYADFLTASEVCRYLQLADKNDRVMVHKIIRDGHRLTEEDEANIRVKQMMAKLGSSPPRAEEQRF